MIKESILNRVKALGGNTDFVLGSSLSEDLRSIEFDTVLYPKNEDTPWAAAEDEEPIYGIGDFIDGHMDLFKSDKAAFYDKIITHFYTLTEDSHGQTMYQPVLFTPLTEGTPDYEEWSALFLDEDELDFKEIRKVTDGNEIEFVQIAYAYDFPSNIYVCTKDVNQENPTVFGTDHTVLFSEVSNKGTLEEYFNSFMTKEELIAIVKNKLEN